MFSDKQKTYLRQATHRWNFKCGATRSGKTYLDYFVIPRRIRALRHQEGLILLLGNTLGTLKRNIIEPMQRIWGTQLVSEVRLDSTATLFGERVHLLGADSVAQVDKLRGMGVKYAYGDEVVSWHPQVFNMLKSRLDKDFSCFDGTCNPDRPGHWLRQFLDSEADIYYQNYTLYDNPFLSSNIIQQMEKEHSGAFFDRYVLGSWVQASGLIYPMFSRKTHVVPTQKRDYERCYISVDYGTLNPCAFGLWGQVGPADSPVYVRIGEYYYDGRKHTPRTDDEHYQALETLANQAPAPISRVIVDPSAASFITLIRRKGRFRVKSADNAVLDGIRECASALQRGLIKVNDVCQDFIKEAEAYAWDEASPTDFPQKENDHAMDDFRYFVKTMRVVRSGRGGLL